MSNLWDLGKLKPRMDVVVPGETMPAMFWNAVAMRKDRILMRQKQLGIWHEWTWAQAAEAVREIGNGLLSLGFQAGDCASIQANTRVEWVLADMAILSAGGVCSGIYPTDAAAQVQYLCEDSHTRYLFVEDDEQLDKALEVRAQLPLLKKVIVIDPEGLRDFSDPASMPRPTRRHSTSVWPAASPRIWRSWSTPRAPRGDRRGRCIRTADWSTRCRA
jgi:long-chain acyl-CoA synthetase